MYCSPNRSWCWSRSHRSLHHHISSMRLRTKWNRSSINNCYHFSTRSWCCRSHSCWGCRMRHRTLLHTPHRCYWIPYLPRDRHKNFLWVRMWQGTNTCCWRERRYQGILHIGWQMSRTYSSPHRSRRRCCWRGVSQWDRHICYPAWRKWSQGSHTLSSQRKVRRCHHMPHRFPGWRTLHSWWCCIEGHIHLNSRCRNRCRWCNGQQWCTRHNYQHHRKHWSHKYCL